MTIMASPAACNRCRCEWKLFEPAVGGADDHIDFGPVEEILPHPVRGAVGTVVVHDQDFDRDIDQGLEDFLDERDNIAPLIEGRQNDGN